MVDEKFKLVPVARNDEIKATFTVPICQCGKNNCPSMRRDLWNDGTLAYFCECCNGFIREEAICLSGIPNGI